MPCDDKREGQLGDILFFDDVVDINVFGSKTDPARVGQTSQMPIGVLGPDGGPSGSQALVESVGRSLQRLTTLPPHVLGVLGARLQASHPGDRAGSEALQAPARQLYRKSMVAGPGRVRFKQLGCRAHPLNRESLHTRYKRVQM